MKETKFSKSSTVSTDPISCTTQNTVLSPNEASVNSPGSSAMCITVFSEGTSKGLERGGGKWGTKASRGSVHGTETSKEGAVHSWMHLLRRVARRRLPYVNSCGRTQKNYGLVAVEELDLKESTVDLVLHPASSRCLSLAWWQHWTPGTGNTRLPRRLCLKQ